jgi:hypothetical protein
MLREGAGGDASRSARVRGGTLAEKWLLELFVLPESAGVLREAKPLGNIKDAVFRGQDRRKNVQFYVK